MGFQLKLLGFWTFLLSALTFCHSQKVTVKVAGTINCTDCIKHEFSTSQEYSGLHITVHCDFQNRETKTHGTSSVDKEGKFNITLSAEIMEDKNSIHRCYATLQSALTTQCPIHKARTASMKILSFHHSATQTLHNIHIPIEFSPQTCQSAFFWPFFKFPPTPEFMLPSPLPPITYAPSSPPAQLPFPPPPPPLPPASRIPILPLSPPLPPTLPPPGPESGNPFPPPPQGCRVPNLPPSPSLPPTLPPPGQESGNLFPPPQTPVFLPPNQVPMPSPAPSPKFQKTIPPSFSKQPVYKTPQVPSPSPLLPSTPPFSTNSPNAPPIPIVESPSPFPMPSEKSSPPPPSPTGISLTPPIYYREPIPIPRPPPVPQLPPMAAVPRKFFNPPKPKSHS